MTGATIRRAEESDAEAIRGIYAPYVTETTITFETEVPSVKKMRDRLSSISVRYPYLVLQAHDGRIAGYAYAHEYQSRAAYQWNAELSIYLDSQYRGQGEGRRLYETLMAILTRQNIHNVYAVITSPNPQSQNFHERLGFFQAGILRRTGFKFGQWLDVQLYEKRLIDRDGQPAAVKPVHELDPLELKMMLEKFSR